MDSILLPRRRYVECLWKANLLRRKVALRPAGLCLRPKLGESTGGDGRAHAGRKLLVIGEVDGRKKRSGKQFAAFHQMMQIGARIVANTQTKTKHNKQTQNTNKPNKQQHNRPV